MKDKFVTDNFELDLSGIRTNFTEENPRFKDSIWNKYTLPVEINYDRLFLSQVAQYSSINNDNLPKEHTGFHIFEGRTMRGKITFSDFRNKKAKIQIDSGFEELPNFEKKLSELPLEHKEVDDIYDHANIICTKKYPETNYNFPKLYTDEFDLNSEGWKYFDSMINNRARPSGGTNKVFPRNEIVENAEGWDCVNRNIVHPMPYILHVLKTGFADAGFNLTGDILQDPKLLQRVIYSGTHYFTTADQKYQKTYVYENEYFDSVGSTAKWKKEFIISAPGKYRIIGKVLTQNSGGCILNIKKNGTQLIQFGSGTTNNYMDFDYVIEVDIDSAKENPIFSLEYSGPTYNNQLNSESVNIGVAEININPMRQNTLAGQPIPFVFNFNEVNLKNAVPDITFGELVNAIKNWRNYDLTFDNGTAIMNRIVIDKTKEPEDFQKFEIEDPYRSKNDKQYFALTFPKVDGLTLDNIFYDESGYTINKNPLPQGTTEIQINGFCLPITTFRAITTAKCFPESNSLMLVYYDGLNAQGDNHAKNPDGLHGIPLADELKDWYLNRLTNYQFKWTFIASRSEIRKFNIRSEIYAYKKNHWIKSWVKNSISENYYSIEIETETY